MISLCVVVRMIQWEAVIVQWQSFLFFLSTERPSFLSKANGIPRKFRVQVQFFGAPFIAITDYEGMECFFDPRLVSSQYVVLLFCAKDLYSVLFWPRVISRAFYREKIVICLPTKQKHLAALEHVRAFQIELDGQCWFLRRGKNRSTRRKTSRNRGEKQQQTNPQMMSTAKIWALATLVGGEWSHHSNAMYYNQF